MTYSKRNLVVCGNLRSRYSLFGWYQKRPARGRVTRLADQVEVFPQTVYAPAPIMRLRSIRVVDKLKRIMYVIDRVLRNNTADVVILGSQRMSNRPRAV